MICASTRPLPEALNAKTIIRRERARCSAAGCQVYRAGGPVLAGDIDAVRAGRGHVRRLLSSIATASSSRSTGSTTTGCCAAASPPISTIDSADRRRALRDHDAGEPGHPPRRGRAHRRGRRTGSKGSRLWTLPKTRRASTTSAATRSIISDQALPESDPGSPAVQRRRTSDVYLRGPDIIVVDQDPSLGTAPRLEERVFARTSKLDDLEDAKLIVDARMSEIRATDGQKDRSSASSARSPPRSSSGWLRALGPSRV